MNEFVGTFDDIYTSWSEKGEVEVAIPWQPFWVKHQPTDVSGFIVRPSFYEELNHRYQGKVTQAVTTHFANYEGGILQGPFQYPRDSEITFSIVGMMLSSAKPCGDGRFQAIITKDPTMEKEGFTFEKVGDFIGGIYKEWNMSILTYFSDGEPFYVGGFSDWRWRAPLCCTLWGYAEMTVKEPDVTPSGKMVLTFQFTEDGVKVELESLDDLRMLKYVDWV